jgi:hypothetical protein
MTEEIISTPGLRVYMRHIRIAKQCGRGAQEWFNANNLDWRDFVKNGIDAQVLIDLGDPIAIRPVLAAQTEALMGVNTDGR